MVCGAPDIAIAVVDLLHELVSLEEEDEEEEVSAVQKRSAMMLTEALVSAYSLFTLASPFRRC